LCGRDVAGLNSTWSTPLWCSSGTWNHTIRKVTPARVVTTIAGQAGSPGSADGVGNAARFNHPSGMTVNNAGNIYVADTYNNTIRKLTPVGTNWVVTTLGGMSGIFGSADGTGGRRAI
jgi:hypothetical protein